MRLSVVYVLLSVYGGPGVLQHQRDEERFRLVKLRFHLMVGVHLLLFHRSEEMHATVPTVLQTHQT